MPPAWRLALTGAQVPGRPSIGAWLTYGLGTQAKDLPGYVVMTSTDVKRTCGQLFYEHYWGSGFIPSRFQGVRLRSEGEPVLYLGDPAGIAREQKRDLLDDLGDLNRHQLEREGSSDPVRSIRASPSTSWRSKCRPASPTFSTSRRSRSTSSTSYGPDVTKKGSYAFHCRCSARRLAERGVRCIQLMHSGWDQHSTTSTPSSPCSAGIPTDLERRPAPGPQGARPARGHPGGVGHRIPFPGRTVFVQGDITKPGGHGRDHFGRAYSVWLAGDGGVKGRPRRTAETDDFAYNVAKDPVHIHDMQATILHLLGIDHERLTYRYQGRQFRLTPTSMATVVPGVLGLRTAAGRRRS